MEVVIERRPWLTVTSVCDVRVLSGGAALWRGGQRSGGQDMQQPTPCRVHDRHRRGHESRKAVCFTFLHLYLALSFLPDLYSTVMSPTSSFFVDMQVMFYRRKVRVMADYGIIAGLAWTLSCWGA